VQVHLLTGCSDRDGEGIAATVGHSVLSNVRFPPPAHRVYCKRIVTSQVNRAASPEVAVQGAGLNGLGA
jgi:hypothetical protein